MTDGHPGTTIGHPPTGSTTGPVGGTLPGRPGHPAPPPNLPTYPGGTPSPGNTGTPEQRDALAQLQGFLNQYGLGSLADWAWQRLLGGDSQDQILLEMYDTPEFKARFPAIALRQEAGLSPISPAEYIAYEQSAHQLLRAAGLPPSFYDKTDDYTALIAGDVSVTELEDRVNKGYVAVANAPASVRAAFNSYFGAGGDGALAAYFLDKDKALPILEQQVAAAQIGGYGADLNFGVSQERAMNLAQHGVGGAQAQSAFGQLDRMRGAFAETAGGAEQDLQVDKEGFDAVFGVGSAKPLQQRLADRAAATAGKGSAASTDKGYVGIGDARAGT